MIEQAAGRDERIRVEMKKSSSLQDRRGAEPAHFRKDTAMDKTGIGPSGLWLRACPAVGPDDGLPALCAGCGSAAQVTSAWRMKGG